MQSAGEAYIEITAKTGELKKQLIQTSEYCTQFGSRMQELEKQMSPKININPEPAGNALKKIANAVAGTVSTTKSSLESFDQYLTDKVLTSFKSMVSHIGTVVAVTTPFTQLGDKFDKMAGRTGMTTEYLSRMGHAANLCGSSIETVEGAVKGLSQKLMDAANGSQDAAKMFSALGLSSEFLSRMSPEEQFNEVVEALHNVGNSTERAALANKLLGDSGVALMPLINSGSEAIAGMCREADSLGITMSGESCTSAAAMSDSLERLKQSLFAISLAVGREVTPCIQEWVDLIRKWITWGLEWQKSFSGILRYVATWSLRGVVFAAAVLSCTAAVSYFIKILYGFVNAGDMVIKSIRGIGIACTWLYANPVWAAIAAVAAAGALIWYFCRSKEEAVKLNDEAQKSRQRLDDLSNTSRGELEELTNLAKKQQLQGEELERAIKLATNLKSQWGDIGITIDAATGKISVASDAMARLNGIIAKRKILALQEEKQERIGNRKKYQMDYDRTKADYESYQKKHDTYLWSLTPEGKAEIKRQEDAYAIRSGQWVSMAPEKTDEAELDRRRIEHRNAVTAQKYNEDIIKATEDRIRVEKKILKDIKDNQSVPEKKEQKTDAKTVGDFFDKMEEREKTTGQKAIDEIVKTADAAKAALERQLEDANNQVKAAKDDAASKAAMARVTSLTEQIAKVDALKKREVQKILDEASKKSDESQEGLGTVSDPLVKNLAEIAKKVELQRKDLIGNLRDKLHAALVASGVDEETRKTALKKFDQEAKTVLARSVEYDKAWTLGDEEKMDAAILRLNASMGSLKGVFTSLKLDEKQGGKSTDEILNKIFETTALQASLAMKAREEENQKNAAPAAAKEEKEEKEGWIDPLSHGSKEDKARKEADNARLRRGVALSKVGEAMANLQTAVAEGKWVPFVRARQLLQKEQKAYDREYTKSKAAETKALIKAEQERQKELAKSFKDRIAAEGVIKPEELEAHNKAMKESQDRLKEHRAALKYWEKGLNLEKIKAAAEAEKKWRESLLKNPAAGAEILGQTLRDRLKNLSSQGGGTFNAQGVEQLGVTRFERETLEVAKNSYHVHKELLDTVRKIKPGSKYA